MFEELDLLHTGSMYSTKVGEETSRMNRTGFQIESSSYVFYSKLLNMAS